MSNQKDDRSEKTEHISTIIDKKIKQLKPHEKAAEDMIDRIIKRKLYDFEHVVGESSC